MQRRRRRITKPKPSKLLTTEQMLEWNRKRKYSKRNNVRKRFGEDVSKRENDLRLEINRLKEACAKEHEAFEDLSRKHYVLSRYILDGKREVLEAFKKFLVSKAEENGDNPGPKMIDPYDVENIDVDELLRTTLRSSCRQPLSRIGAKDGG